MKKQTQVERDSEDVLDKEFAVSFKNSKEAKANKLQQKQDIIKYMRLVHISVLVLATVLLVKQDFMYARVLGVFVGLTALERVWLVTFRGR